MGNNKGMPYSDQLEVHVIELDKALTGDRLDDWIRLFRVENMEELKMLHSANPGVMEAVKEVMTMNMGRAAGGISGKSRQVIYDFLERLGTIPEDIRTRIEAEQDVEVLREWYMSVPQLNSFDEFRDIIN